MKKICLFSILCFCLTASLCYAENHPTHVLFSGGGDWHPYAQCSGALIDVMRTRGNYICTYSEDPADLKYNHLKHFDVLVIYNGVFYEGKEGNQQNLTPDYIPGSIKKFVAKGGGLVCVHSAIASFSDWDGFLNLIGGIWDWKTSAHDKYGELKSVVVKPTHPVLEGIPNTFEFQDEFYHTLTLQPDIEILIESTHEKNGASVTEPLAWVAKDTQKERVITLLHGHDMGSWGHPTFQQLMINAIDWAARKQSGQ